MTRPEAPATPSRPPGLWHRTLRLLRHRWLAGSAGTLAAALPADQVDRLTQAIAGSEAAHTAQIRVCIEASLPASYAWRPLSTARISRERALGQFAKLRVWDTEHNNGVLVYLLLPEHTIEIVADRAVHRAVPQALWDELIARMRSALATPGRTAVADALLGAIDGLTPRLQVLFPRQPGAGADVPGRTPGHANELPDRPHIG